MFLGLPAFMGNFTSPLLKLQIPNDYLQTFNYFQHQDENARIALLPAHTFWNWQYRTWGQRGSGFLWYGIPQSIMERAFDPWSNYNEQAFNELSYTINSQDKQAFLNVLVKYNMSYVLVDQYLLDTLTRQPVNYDSLNRFLSSCPFLQKKKEFGKIEIYYIKPADKWIYSLAQGSTAHVSPQFNYENVDLASNDSSNYIYDTSLPDLGYLFPSLFTEKEQEDLEFNANDQGDNITITSNKTYPQNQSNLELEIPNIYSTEFLIPFSIQKINNIISFNVLYPKLYINNQLVPLASQPIQIHPTVVKNPQQMILQDTNDTINMTKSNNRGYLINNTLNIITLKNGKNKENVEIDLHHGNLTPFHYKIASGNITLVKAVIHKIHGPLANEQVIAKGNYQIHEFKNPINPYGSSFGKVEKNQSHVTLTVQSESEELTLYQNNLFHQGSYILFANTTYGSGLPINFYVDNTFEKRAEVESDFSEYRNQTIEIIPPTEMYFSGYGFHFTVKSVGNEIASSTINDINIYPFPQNFLKSIKILSNNTGLINKNQPSQSLQFSKPLPFIYIVKPTSTASYLVLSQSFESGWHAYAINELTIPNILFPFLFERELPHVLVNNWANGWTFNLASTYIDLIFIPQYLTFIGILILLISIIYLLLKKYSA